MLKEKQRASAQDTYTEEASSPKPSPPSQPTASPSSSSVDGLSPFFTVLVTPKITFSLPRKAAWRTPQDIPQSELQEAFLARFPVRIDASSLIFKCATPTLDLATQERIVFRISNGGDDERVLLSILSSLDRAYSAKYEKQLEEARADLLSSSMSFQVVADEVRAAQSQTNKRWEREVKSLKEQQSTNQKRLFLLEREKEGLQKACSLSEEGTDKLRRSMSGLVAENALLREKTAEMEAQIAALRVVVETHLGAAATAIPASGIPAAAIAAAPRSEAGTQTGESPADDAARTLAMERWQQQLSAMGEWLRTGAALLEHAPPVVAAPDAAAVSPAVSPAVLAADSWGVGHVLGAEPRAPGEERPSATASEDKIIEPSSVC